MQAAQQRTQYLLRLRRNAVKGVVLLFSRSSIFMNAGASHCLSSLLRSLNPLSERYFCIILPKGIEKGDIRFLPLLLIKSATGGESVTISILMFKIIKRSTVQIPLKNIL